MPNSATQYACAILILAASAAGAQNPPGRVGTARAAASGELRDSLAAILAAGVADRAFPGAYAVVGDAHGVLAEASAGRLDWRADAPVPGRETLWDLASLTKVMVTTMAVAQLVDRGAIDIHAPVQRYLPDWQGPGKHRVLVWHLLTHTSGLPSFRPYDRQTQDPDSLARLLFTTTLERQPGDSMVYSDIGAYVLGEVITRVAGMPLDVWFARHIATPLRLTGTLFNPAEATYARTAPTEIDSLRGGLVHGKVHDERAYYLGGVAAHAGLFGTGRDLSRFATMLLRGGALGGRQVLRTTTLRSFTAYADSARHNRALGWQKPPAAWAPAGVSTRAYGHTGFTGTSLLVDPDRNLYVILLSNRVNPTRNNPRIGAVRTRLAAAAVGVADRHAGKTPAPGAP